MSSFRTIYRRLLHDSPLLSLVKDHAFASAIGFKPLRALVAASVSRSWSRESLAFPLIRASVYTRFCGGDSYTACVPVINRLVSERVSVIMDESRETGTDYDRNTQDAISNIYAYDATHCRFIPLKCTSYLSAEVMQRVADCIARNTHIDTHTNDVHSVDAIEKHLRAIEGDASLNIPWKEGLDRIRRICAACRERGISVLLDAEQSSLQPAVEALYWTLAPELNSTHALLYNTYQCYLRRTPSALMRDLQFCAQKGVFFAVKLVRGAYLSTETNNAHNKNNNNNNINTHTNTNCTVSLSPLWETKERVDDCYHELTELLLTEIAQSREAKLAVMFATHNVDSVGFAFLKMREKGVNINDKRVQFAQILGMADRLTRAIAEYGGNASKLVLFGKFDYLFAWLLRRWEENQENLGALQHEKRLISEVIKSKISGGKVQK